jgi:quinoprotein glucose dehydrogenase
VKRILGLLFACGWVFLGGCTSSEEERSGTPPTSVAPASDASANQMTGASGDWRHIGGNQAMSRYSPLDQITPENFTELEVAWRWESADRRLGDVYDTGAYVAVPLVVGGRVYAVTSHGQVAALDGGTGKQIWLYDPRSWAIDMPTQLPRHTRGIEYWTDGEIERIFVATMGRQLVSIDVATGRPDPGFGENGIVDLNKDLGDGDWVMDHITHKAPPIVVRDTVIVGSSVHDYVSELRNPPGHVRAYDARTGEFKWRFDMIPKEGDFGSETWPATTINKQGNTNVWAFMAADEELGYVYLPTSTPTNDYYGGEREGDNLFAESLVCVDVETGKRVWHFQTVHHGIWDYDIASAPNLFDLEIDGRQVKGVAQVSKTAFTYVLDRATGEPVWPIEERPVPQSTVPGEKLSPTQPFPTKPPPFDRQGISEDDLIDFTPELRAEALDIADKFLLGPIFTPLIVEGELGKLGTYVVPGAGGGATHVGASYDPETGYLYVESQTRPVAMSLVKPETGESQTFGLPESGKSDFAYEIKYQSTGGPRGLPLLKPPYRRLTAIDMSAGEHVFQVPLGRGITDHPEIKHLDLGPMGSPYMGVAEGGVLVTKTMLVNYLPHEPEMTDDAEDVLGFVRQRPPGGHLRALDKTTGEVLAQVEVDRTFFSLPISYAHEGRQYIAIVGGGQGRGGRSEKEELIVYALPEQ